MTRCSLYLRVSTPGQAERSIPDQEAACRALATERRWEVVAVYRDEGLSAYKAGTERPAFEAMRTAAAMREFDVLLAWDTDRLTRGAGRKSLVALRWELRDAGVRLVTVNQPEIEDDDLAELMDVVDGQRARRESQAKSDRAKRGAERRAREGKFSGHAPFGYRWRDGNLEPEPAAAPIVERIFSDWLDGVSQAEIARRLDSTGVPTARGGRWHQGTVAQVLKNVVYTGQFQYDGDVYDGDHPPLVSEDDFRRAQSLMAPKKPSGRSHGRVAQHHLLSRMLVCGECGETMLCRAGERNKDGSYYRVYVCPTSSGKVAGRCSMPPVRQEAVDTAVIDHFTKHVIDIEATKAQFQERNDARIKRLADERDAAARRYADAKRKYERARELAVSGDFDASDLGHYREQRDVAEAASNAALDRYNDAQTAELPEDLEAKVAEKLSALADTVAGRIEDGGGAVTQQRAQLRQVFERFVVYLGDVDPAKAVLHPTWPVDLPEAVLSPADAEALPASTPDLGEKRLLSRTEDPEAAVAVGEPDEAIAFTILPELRSDVIEGWGLDCQPVVEKVPLRLSGGPEGGTHSPTSSAGGGATEEPEPAGDTGVGGAGGAPLGSRQNNVEGFAT